MSDFIGTKLTMNLGERSYDIILKNGALENLYQFARLDRRVAVVTDSGVPAQYAQRVADQCRESTIITVPQGEASKSFKILETVLRQMLEFNMGRGDLVVAVGGGVVGDLAGFAAAIYMRGIDFINCPTTTLSMIDSSIGGKTAVDLGDTKNIVGAFWQPKLVIVDPDTLSTLPRRHYINGLAEAVKASLLADPELFAIFEKHQSRYRPHIVHGRSLTIAVDINFDDTNAVAKTLFDILKNGSLHLTRPAPCGIKIHKHRLTTINQFIEIIHNQYILLVCIIWTRASRFCTSFDHLNRSCDRTTALSPDHQTP